MCVAQVKFSGRELLLEFFNGCQVLTVEVRKKSSFLTKLPFLSKKKRTKKTERESSSYWESAE